MKFNFHNKKYNRRVSQVELHSGQIDEHKVYVVDINQDKIDNIVKWKISTAATFSYYEVHVLLGKIDPKIKKYGPKWYIIAYAKHKSALEIWKDLHA